MSSEQLYIYYYDKQSDQADEMDIILDALGYNVEKINLDKNKSDEAMVKNITGGDIKLLPLLVVGGDKIRATFFKPSEKLLEKLFDSEAANPISLPKPVVYTSTWCSNCHMVKMVFEDREISYKEINIETKEEMAQKLIQWSGGRRVVPTVEYKNVGRLFNPDSELMNRLYE